MTDAELRKICLTAQKSAGVTKLAMYSDDVLSLLDRLAASESWQARAEAAETELWELGMYYENDTEALIARLESSESALAREREATRVLLVALEIDRLQAAKKGG